MKTKGESIGDYKKRDLNYIGRDVNTYCTYNPTNKKTFHVKVNE
jgi:hypothetical protein